MKSKLFYSDIEKKIISNLSNAKKNVKIAIAWFTNPTLFNLVEDLIDNQINVEIILSDEKLNFINEKIDFQKLIDKNVTIKISRFPNLMHNKFCIIDDRILITGSYNWTLKAEKCNLENIIISTDEKLVDDFINYFENLQEQLEPLSNISKTKFNEYLKKNEVEIEIDLIKNEKEKEVEITTIDTKKTYDNSLNTAIDKAELLYLNGKLKESIKYVKQQLKVYKDIPEFYQILALCYWRLKDSKNQIKFAQKVIELENNIELKLDSYNLLGIGYSLKKGGEQQSIFYFKKCIKHKPNEHTFYRNRAISYIYLEQLAGLPLKMKNNYKQKADKDLEKVIEIAKNTEIKDYQILHSEALAYDLLENPKFALSLINKSIKAYESEKDIYKKDENELKEIKVLKKEILKRLKQ